MRKQLLSIFLLMSSWATAENPIAIRAAIDIGMGGPKLQVAEVDLETNKIVKVLHTQKYFVNFYDSMSHQLSSDIMTEGLEAFKNAVKTAHYYNADRITAIATAALRSASNGMEFARLIQEETGIQVHVIDQNLEGRLAFQAVLSKIVTDPENLVAWDIGGGSIQLISQTSEGAYLVDAGKEGVGAFIDYIIRDIQSRDIKECRTPNPLSSEDIFQATEYAQNLSCNVSKVFKDKIAQTNTQVIGVGNAFGYGVASMVGKDAFCLDEIRIAAHQLAGKTDADLGGGEFAYSEGANVLLAFGFMQGLGIKNIQILQVNNADGALLYEPFWE